MGKSGELVSAGRCEVLAPVACAVADVWPSTRVERRGGRWWRYLPTLGAWCLAGGVESPEAWAAAEAREVRLRREAVGATQGGRVVEGEALAAEARDLDAAFEGDYRGAAPRTGVRVVIDAPPETESAQMVWEQMVGPRLAVGAEVSRG